ncbi:MAG: ABC transporter permease [Bacteroidales bacterium]|nr:ABC transporter permease [Bacteroidales bacterium]MCD8393224.1 ABC transporter permease [Bacteroidales bacterium]
MIDLFREISQSLSHNKLRTALTGVAVAWGIFMLIVLLGMAGGIVNAFNSSGMAAGSNYLTVWGGRTEKAYQGYKEGRRIRLYDDDQQKVAEAHTPGVANVSASVSLSSTVNISTSSDYVSGSFTGVYPDALTSDNLKLLHGRFINQSDIAQKRKVLVMNKNNAEVLFKDPAKAVGQQVSAGSLGFTVVGVYDADWRSNFYIPFSTARMLNSDSRSVSQLNIEIEGINSEEEGQRVEDDVRATLAQIKQFDPQDQSGVWIWNRIRQYMQTQSGLSILSWVVWIIGLFTMLSGIVGVSNIMFVSVKERTHEIGIRRAIGAKPRAILRQIILESVVITTMFGYIGIVLGIIVNQGLAVAFAEQEWIKDPSIDISIAIQVTVVLIIAGALAGLFPALKALKVKPVEALRTE